MLKGLLFSYLSLGFAPLQAQDIPASVFQNQGGVEIELQDLHRISELVEHEGVMIDHGCTHQKAKLYVTQEGYEYLMAENIAFRYVKRPPVKITMKGPDDIHMYRADCMPAMDFYPTYEAYVELMYSFAMTHPELCEIINIGTLDSGRELLVAHLGDRVTSDEDEPNFLYTSTMHGDETAGFPVMLQLIDYLLCNYGEVEQVTELMDNINIYINPLANPDGAYAGNNSTVANATRSNANFVDLNRNFPDPEDGNNPDNRPTQQETQFFIDFAEAHGIHMSCNIHGGAEVVSYPWDTWANDPADLSWWIQSCNDYAEAAQANGPAGYMNRYDDGIINGFDWFEVNGGRQDLMNYFIRAREMTLEISNIKLLNSDDLPVIWEANRESLLTYMNAALHGLRGVIIDCATGLPIEAEIIIPGHDVDNSSVFSDSEKGNYFRYLDAGNYEVMYVAEGYDTVFSSIAITDYDVHREDVELCPMISSSTEENAFDNLNYFVAENLLVLEGPENLRDFSVELYNNAGQQLLIRDKYIAPINVDVISSGIYLLRLSHNEQSTTYSIAIP